MQVSSLNVSKDAAIEALAQYKAHRNVYDSRDWQIERIYRAIAKGKMVISAAESIRNGGLDEKGRPRLAICEAHAKSCRVSVGMDEVVFGIMPEGRVGESKQGRIRVPWAVNRYSRADALLPRIPPQFRPPASSLSNYHLLWEADWQDIPRDPMLLRRIGKDAWIVLAAWDLTDVEMNVLRSQRGR